MFKFMRESFYMLAVVMSFAMSFLTISNNLLSVAFSNLSRDCIILCHYTYTASYMWEAVLVSLELPLPRTGPSLQPKWEVWTSGIWFVLVEMLIVAPGICCSWFTWILFTMQCTVLLCTCVRKLLLQVALQKFVWLQLTSSLRTCDRQFIQM